jgi:hypothetical protein
MNTSDRRIFEIDEECPDCHGTGLYVGFAEPRGVAIVCKDCDGTGKLHFRYSYRPFVKRQPRKGITRVVQYSGVGVSKNDGMDFADWDAGKPFPAKSEDRVNTCPAWWYQNVDIDKKPDWDRCIGAGCFSDCAYFKTKKECWKRWDKEFGK